MAAIVWNRAFNVGIRRLDRQHRRIVEVLNQLHELDRAREQEQLGQVFAALRDYLMVHFRDEERLMLRHGFPSADEHRQEHERLIDAVCDYHREFLKGRRLALINLYNLLWDWLVGHVLVADRSLGAWCRRTEALGARPVPVPAPPRAAAGR